MSQQIINISTPDDGLGDVLRNGFDKANKNFTELYNGKVDKIAGKGLSKNDFTDIDKTKLNGIEAGAEVNVQADWRETDPLAKSFILNKPPSLYSAFGYFHYSDLATQTTPITLTGEETKKLTNDGLGVFTNLDQAPYGVASVWSSSTNALNFTQLNIGDACSIGVDLSISTTAVNQTLRLYIKLGIGTPSERDLLIDSWNEKSVITASNFIKDISFSIDNLDWKDAPAEIYIYSDNDASIKVNDLYIPIIRKSINIVDFNSDPLKLDKVSTPSGVYTTDAGGLQVMKPLSDFKDVLEFTDFDTFPTTGATGKIYVALDTNKTYRWSGSAYVQIGGREIYIKNVSVSGGYTVDFNVDTHRLTLIGNTTFSEINLPALGFSKTITLHINGNFGVVFPASWTQYISGAYNGTAPLNTIVIETIGTERKVQISQPD